MVLIRSLAIYKYCFECSAGSIGEVEKCPIVNCPLYPYRNRKAAKITKEEKEKLKSST